VCVPLTREDIVLRGDDEQASLTTERFVNAMPEQRVQMTGRGCLGDRQSADMDGIVRRVGRHDRQGLSLPADGDGSALCAQVGRWSGCDCLA
jgi:hypothetical protein